MFRALLIAVGVISVSALETPSTPLIHKILSKSTDKKSLGQGAFPIPVMPDNFEINGRYWQYSKSTGELKDTNFLFHAKVSDDLNCMMFEQNRRYEVSQGNFTTQLVLYVTQNYTKGEEIEYF